MAYDIQAAVSGHPVKNGTSVVTTTFTGKYSTIDTYAKSTPTISDLDDKYDNRFYNGVFVTVLTSGHP